MRGPVGTTLRSRSLRWMDERFARMQHFPLTRADGHPRAAYYHTRTYTRLVPMYRSQHSTHTPQYTRIMYRSYKPKYPKLPLCA